jgi:HemY protein
MLWSLLKILLFVAAIAALTIGAERLLETDEGLRISVANMEFTLGPLQTVVVVLALVASVWLLFKVIALFVATLRFLNGDETAISRYFNRNREARGFQAVVDSMTALASGEANEALSKAAKAEKILRKPELTNLISAQAAEMQGDHGKALDYYKRLLNDPRTKFAGVRGALRQKIAMGDKALALKLAEKGFALRPGHDEMQQTLLQLQAEHREWDGARKTLLARKRSGALPKDVYKRRDAVLALQLAADLAEKGETARAQETAIEAHRLSPDLVPAAAAAARAKIAQNAPRPAAKLLRKTWAVAPHPDLAAAFAEIVPDETPQQRLARFAALIKQAPDHDETRMLKAELLIAAEDFPEARRAMGDLVERAPTARVLTIMAAIERGEGSADAVVRGWLTRALVAPRGPQWVCDKCQNIHSSWVAVCENCGTFDSLSWREPPQGAGPSPTQTEMLPLIVGQIEQGRPDPAQETTADDAEIVPPEASTGR